jgi:hypothetical protein
MKKISILLWTKDTEYGSALAMSLNNLSKRFSIRMVQACDESCEALEKGDYDLVLTDDMSKPIPKSVYLTEDYPSQRIQAERWIFVVYKYQPAGSIAKVLRMAHSVFSGTGMASDEALRCNIVTICSPTGGSGCTTVTLGICQELKRFHQCEVLYVSLEEFESTADYFPSTGFPSVNITRYLYLLLNHENTKDLDPESCMCQNEYGVYAFQPAMGRNPLRELDCWAFTQFINRIAEKSIFSYIVIDCGSGFDEAVKAAMQLSGEVCCLTSRSTPSHRISSYMRHVTVASGMDSGDVRWIRNFCETDDPGEDADFCGAEEAWIRKGRHQVPLDGSSISYKEGSKSISLNKKLGHGINCIVQQIQHMHG